VRLRQGTKATLEGPGRAASLAHRANRSPILGNGKTSAGGYARVFNTLRRHFFEADPSRPLDWAAFALEGQSVVDDRDVPEGQIVEQVGEDWARTRRLG
jgi:hypothetical protein